MRLCTTHSVVRRIWTVELRPERGGPALHCPQCPPGSPSVRAAASQALAHLARHARRDVLPQHLRTCQCYPHGCRWHPRHRGCSGPVLLVLTREKGGRLWRLADICAACAAATTHAAVVPDTALGAAASAGPVTLRRKRSGNGGPSEQVRVREMLSYLAAALPSGVSPAARLLALQCSLRSTAAGNVRLPAGLVRGMGIGSCATTYRELEEAHWLYSPTAPEAGREGFTAQLLDLALRTQAPARKDRARAADWSLRSCRAKNLRRLDPLSRLLALALTAHCPEEGDRSATPLVERAYLARICGVTLQGLAPALDRLLEVCFLRQWAYSPGLEDMRWEVAQPSPPWCATGTGMHMPQSGNEPCDQSQHYEHAQHDRSDLPGSLL